MRTKQPRTRTFVPVNWSTHALIKSLRRDLAIPGIRIVEAGVVAIKRMSDAERVKAFGKRASDHADKDTSTS